MTTPLALRVLEPAPSCEVPEYRYDPGRQIAVTSDGQPLAPTLAKRWTSYESTHTDGAATGAPMTAAMADLLEKGPHP